MYGMNHIAAYLRMDQVRRQPSFDMCQTQRIGQVSSYGFLLPSSARGSLDYDSQVMKQDLTSQDPNTQQKDPGTRQVDLMLTGCACQAWLQIQENKPFLIKPCEAIPTYP